MEENMEVSGSGGRKEKRKEMKRLKRKQKRKEMAEKERMEEEARLNDPEELMRLQLIEQQEAERMEKDRIAFDQREKAFIETINLNKQLQLQLQQQSPKSNHNTGVDVDVDDEYVEMEEEGPPEIIWQGNEIIFKKKKVRVRVSDKEANPIHSQGVVGDDRPTSNPFPPESQSHTNSAALLDNVARQVPNFGTEQDKDHCPFHLKTGACRFGQRCSRVHFYPDKSCTILIKNMYNGPGLAWEQDEGLEYTDEEVESCFEEFYEDVHTEFLKFGEIVNFKVCKNGSFHLRGNVYVQYKLLDSALLAYNSVNGRYFAGKQVSCEFINLTRWKVAICGEYMKSGFKTCSHGTACNFIHCFRNPGGDYEWADSDKPPPKFWVRKMAALFGYSDDYEILREQGNLSVQSYRNMSKTDSDRHHSRRSQSGEMDQLNSGYSDRRKHEDERNQRTPNEGKKRRDRTPDTDSDKEWLEEEEDRVKHHRYTRKSSINKNNKRSHEEDSDVDWTTKTRGNKKQHDREGRNSQKSNWDTRNWNCETGSDGDRDRKRHHINQEDQDIMHHSRRSRSIKMDQLNSGCSHRRKQERERKERTPDEERSTNIKDNLKKKCRGRTPDTDSDKEWSDEEQTRKNSHNRNHSSNHEEDSDVDCGTITRDNEKQPYSKGRNSHCGNWIYETGSDRGRDRKKHHIDRRSSSRYQSRDSSHVTAESESESDNDRGEMESQHDYSRKSLRHMRYDLQNYCEDYENENDKIDGGWSQRESERAAHHHKKKRAC
ncbi:zinc finger CCCH domain-containing protein 5 isoform X2 [Lotus japonicus]|uniref:zinc finger CCCH domain-containing protein 5 isoform X2 n=1 Tax=Lotus japonicus TaxID=34305 RepID=UPI00258DBA7C|nr:zinc finger CCCH domain-containing protein 5 isoform X2 [Lotus japonicus]